MRKLVPLTLASLCLMAALGTLSAGDDSSLPPDNYDDGPHVIWKNDTTAFVINLVRDSLYIDTHHVDGSFSFDGRRADSLVTYTIQSGSIEIGPHIFDHVARVLAVSDIHGEYYHFFNILLNSGVIDSSGSWIWRDGHLVIDGDVFDRGSEVTECLWLIYRLEKQARSAGGKVHFVLGNHELMVIRGDNRYIHERYLDGIVKRSRISHEDLFGPDSELGRWLRTKHAAIRINNLLFVHGGIHPLLPENDWTPGDINDAVRRYLDLRSSEYAFNDTARLLYGSSGPLWYRGYHYSMEDKYPMASEAEIDSILTRYSASSIIVGHTEQDSIQSLYSGRVIAIDIPVEQVGSLQALLWQDNVFYRVAGNGSLQPID